MLLGKILAPHGLKGFVRVDSYAETTDRFCTLEHVFLSPEGGVTRPAAVEQVGNGERSLLLKFKGIDTVHQAQRLVGSTISVDRAALEDTAEDEYYWFELIGLDVLDENGVSLGTVENMFRTGAHDILVIRNASEEILVPAVTQYVREVKIEQGLIIVRVPEPELP